MRTAGLTSPVVRLWWRNTAKQQTVISSQRQYTEKRDLACPHDFKSKRARTVFLVHAPGEFKKKKENPITSLIAPTPPLFSFHPLCHPFPPPKPLSSRHKVVYPQLAVRLIHLCFFHSILPLPSLWTDRKLWLDFQETRDDTRLNVCSLDKSKKQTTSTSCCSSSSSPEQ